MKVEVIGIDRVLKRLNEMKNSLDHKQKKFIERLGEIGISEAQMGFNAAPYDGERDAQVGQLEWISDNTAQIIASGRTVLFIEFGAGITYNAGDSYGPSHGYGPGTYGPNGNKPYWFYKGQPGDAGGELVRDGVTVTYGNPASKPMYYAAKEMRLRIEEIAKEVFGDG